MLFPEMPESQHFNESVACKATLPLGVAEPWSSDDGRVLSGTVWLDTFWLSSMSALRVDAMLEAAAFHEPAFKAYDLETGLL